MRSVVIVPVRQTPEVLGRSLACLARCGARGYWFTDDNTDPASSTMLRSWAADRGGRIFDPPPRVGTYARAEGIHQWDDTSCRRVGSMFDTMIEAFLQSSYDAAFFVGSDVLVPPGLVAHLAGLDVPIACEVYWTRWTPERVPMPQVWDFHPGGYDSVESVLRLREPGLYRVYGQGACTLVQREVLEAGVRFADVPGVRLIGEDRHFCIRAAALGFDMWADTHMPPFHVYRDSQLPEADAWIAAGCPADWFRTRWLDAEWEGALRASTGR